MRSIKSNASEPQDEKAQQSVTPRGKRKKPKKKHRGLRIAAVLLCIVLALEGLYCFVIFTDIPAIKSLREAYIETAMSTMSHHWLAEWFFPEYMVNDVVTRIENAQKAQIGINSNWRIHNTQPTKPPTSTEATEPPEDADESAFYELFWELNHTSFEDYLAENPDTLANGWENIYINEAGLDDEGTSIYTSMGEQVLALDAKNKILLVRVEGSGYRGVLAIAKDPAQLSCAPSEYIGSFGQSLEAIAENNNAILAMTGSGFIDEGGVGNGGLIAGYAMCNGESYGSHYSIPGYKRIELRKDNLLYITDVTEPVSSDVTDAVEFSPALIVDGKILVDGFSAWNAINPRACIGQSERKEILMLVIEGRMVGRSVGTDVETCTNILKRHEGYQAMNLDGGTSAVLWFDGEYVTKCSNTSISSRYLPNAWIYSGAE